VQLRNRLECLLEEAHLKVSSLVSDLLGLSARRMLRAIASGETEPATIAALGSPRLHATPDQLRDALGASTELDPVYRRLLAMTLDELAVFEAHLRQLDEELARLLRVHQTAVERLAAVPGLGRHVRDGQAFGLVGRRLSGPRRERRSQSQPSVTERQSADASPSQPSRTRRGQDERQYL
jgi:hypothetical protein